MRKKLIRPAIRGILQHFGYDIIKTNPVYTLGNLDPNILRNEYAWLIEYEFKTILDIGANEGQFTEKMRILFPEAKIIAFEPLPDTFNRLNDNFSKDNKIVLINSGLGNVKTDYEINLNKQTASSSFLEMSDIHKKHFEKAIPENRINVKLDTLDNLALNLNIEHPSLIKIDVQGFEQEVIKGGFNTIKNAKAIICELSFQPLYHNQPLFDDIYRILKDLGFNYAGNLEQLHSENNRSILQADGFFIRN